MLNSQYEPLMKGSIRNKIMSQSKLFGLIAMLIGFLALQYSFNSIDDILIKIISVLPSLVFILLGFYFAFRKNVL